MAKFWINSLGEFGRDGSNLKVYGGCYNTEALAKFAKVENWLDLSRDKQFEICREYYLKDAKEKLNEKEFSILQRHNELSDLTTALFRFNGGVDGDAERLVLSFEFYLFTDMNGLSDAVKVRDFTNWMEKVSHLKMVSYVMDAGIHNDHSWETKVVEKKNMRGYEKVEGSDKYGPDHGRPYEQIAMDVDILSGKYSKGDVAQLCGELRSEMERRDILKLTVSVL